jgi:hypothetical protein
LELLNFLILFLAGGTPPHKFVTKSSKDFFFVKNINNRKCYNRGQLYKKIRLRLQPSCLECILQTETTLFDSLADGQFHDNPVFLLAFVLLLLLMHFFSLFLFSSLLIKSSANRQLTLCFRDHLVPIGTDL